MEQQKEAEADLVCLARKTEQSLGAKSLGLRVLPTRKALKRENIHYPHSVLGFVLPSIPSSLPLYSRARPNSQPIALCREGQRGSWGKGHQWWEPVQPTPEANVGGALADFQLPPLCPSLWDRKNSLFSFSIQDPERRTCSGGGRSSRMKGGSLLPLSFLPGQPLAPNLCRILAMEPELFARTGGGRGSVPQLWACRRTRWKLRERRC